MEHVVFHPGPDGSPSFRRFGSLEDAVRFVEHLRNVEGVTDLGLSIISFTSASVAAPILARADRPAMAAFEENERTLR